MTTITMPLDLATRAQRLSAATIDSLLSAALCGFSIFFTTDNISQSMANEMARRMQSPMTESEMLSLLAELPVVSQMLTTWAACILLYNFSELLFPCSLGKYLTGIKIISSDGTTSGIVQRTVRFIVKQAAFIVLLTITLRLADALFVFSALNTLGFAGTALVLLPDRMALHDYVAKTKIVKSK